MTFRRYRRVEVEWEDAASHSGWLDVPKPGEVTPLMVRSTGYLVQSDKRGITLAQSITSHDKLGDILRIPRVWVRKVRRS